MQGMRKKGEGNKVSSDEANWLKEAGWIMIDEVTNKVKKGNGIQRKKNVGMKRY